MDIKTLYEKTDLTQKEIALKLGIHWKKVYKFIKENYTPKYRTKRKSRCYRQSKLGDKNPMKGQCGVSHPRFIGEVSDNKGYLMVLKPDWYTGRKRSKYVFSHHIVVCLALKITEIPKGWCVHHCDGNPYNNDFNNLILVTMKDHARIHSLLLKGATTISKESTAKWLEAHGTPFKM